MNYFLLKMRWFYLFCSRVRFTCGQSNARLRKKKFLSRLSPNFSHIWSMCSVIHPPPRWGMKFTGLRFNNSGQITKSKPKWAAAVSSSVSTEPARFCILSWAAGINSQTTGMVKLNTETSSVFTHQAPAPFHWQLPLLIIQSHITRRFESLGMEYW